MTLKPRFLIGVAATLSLTLLLIQPGRAAITDAVRTDSGLVSGTAVPASSVRVFKGIPYAAPPVGGLRWRPPQATSAWDGVRAATAFGSNCVQQSPGGASFPPYGGDRSATTMSEDCLYLNVYTAAASSAAKAPVMVWIHGGAWTSGAGAIYQGEDLARKGVVVVTINYRLGVFGFLAHPELTRESPQHSSGNYALLDQIAALRWVQRNIAAFGGDPSRVTIFGESAGSWSVHNLVASPLAAGLFHRAIGESGGRFSVTTTLQQAERAGEKFGAAVGAISLARLRALPAGTLQGASGVFASVSNADGWVLPAIMRDVFRTGKQNDVPTLVGSNADEGTIFAPASTTGETFRRQAEREFGSDAERWLRLHPFATDAQARSAQAQATRDRMFGWEMRTWARMQARTGKSRVFLYYFSHVPPRADAAWLGAQHGAEIPYVLNWPNGAHAATVPWTDADRTLADRVSSYWVNFATTGDPNGKGLAPWSAYSRNDERALGIAGDLRMIPIPHAASLDVVDDVMARERN